MNRKSILASIIFLGVTMSVCRAAGPENGLVAYWPMDEGQGDLAHDTGGSGHDAKISGAKWVTLREGSALEFDGIDDVLECGDSEDLNLTEKVSVEAWVYHRGLPRSNTSIIQKGRGYSLGTGYGGEFLFAGRCQTPDLLLSDFWHHMVGIFDGETIAFYLDGNLIDHAEPTEKGALPDSKDDPLVMASPDADTIFKGMLDDVRIYNRPLSREEVKEHFEAGRRAHENPLRVYAYPFNSQIVVQIDPAAWDKVPPESVIEVNLVGGGRSKVAVKQVVESFPADAPFEADLRVGDLPAGDYDVHVWPRHKRSPAAGRELIASLHWPQRPAWEGVSSEAQVLNNFVTELLDVRPGRRGEVAFTNPRTGWVFFSWRASDKDEDQIDVILEGPAGRETLLKHAPGEAPLKEAMRFLEKGAYVLRINARGKSRLDRLVVRAIPELGFAYLTQSSYPHTFKYGAYDWLFLSDNHLLENMNVIAGGGEWALPHIEQWRRRGKRRLGGISLDRNNESVDEIVQQWTDALNIATVDGTTIDEFPGGHPGYGIWTEAVRRIRADETLSDKRLYLYCSTLYGWDEPVAFTQAIVDSDYRIVWERYLSEAPTQIAARRFIFASLGDRMRLWEKHIPGVTSKLLVCPNLFTSPSLTADMDPAVDYLVFMDMRFHHMANDPGFWGVAGFLPWGAAYADEEVFRWLGKLYRHYCIEGNTEMLTSGKPARKGTLPHTSYRREYKLTHLSNGNFAEGLDGWTVLRADKGTIEARTELGLDRAISAWYQPLQRDSFCWMKRHQWAPNTIVQQIEDLEPHRLYSLRFHTRDFKDPQTRQELCVSAKITPAEIIPEKSVRHVYLSYEGDKGWLNFHRLVFRAKAPTARLEISDWKMEPGRPFFSGGKEGHVYLGAPAEQETMITFVQIQPYLAD